MGSRKPFFSGLQISLVVLMEQSGGFSFVTGFSGHTSGCMPWIFLYLVTNKLRTEQKKKKSRPSPNSIGRS